MRNILIIGIGAGNPDHMTVEAIAALNRADVLFIPDKGEEKAALRHLRETICARFIRAPGYRTVPVAIPCRAEAGNNYQGVVDDWHARISESYRALFETELAEEQTGALLVWGDPALYDSTLRIMERVAASGLALDWQVYPGISSVQVLAARHRIPLNGIGTPVLFTTGRRLGRGFPADQDRVVVVQQREGLIHQPNLMLINDADTQARWWMRVKEEWRESQEEGRAFANPLQARTLRWRS